MFWIFPNTSWKIFLLKTTEISLEKIILDLDSYRIEVIWDEKGKSVEKNPGSGSSSPASVICNDQELI